MRLYVFDDDVADGWAPFALTRPCSELLFGSLLLRERLERAADRPTAGLLSRPWLGQFREGRAPRVVRPRAIDAGEGRLFLSSRFVPEANLPPSLEGPVTFHTGGQAVGGYLPAGTDGPDPAWFRRPRTLPASREVELPGSLLGPVWDLVARNPDRLLADLLEAAEGRGAPAPGAPVRAAALPDGVHALGDGPLLIGEGSRIEPGVLLDTREGPIRLDEGVEVRAPARLAGPLHAGLRSRLLGGSLEALSAGPLSYLRGEIEASVVLGHANKAHDGFLGHAYLGRWVNLGAMTTNSDLKNNYSPVRMGPPDGRVDTGLLKFGCLLGDHVKTGIGLLLGTGTVVGAGSNLFGGTPPSWVPPFSWGAGEELTAHRREAFLRTAESAMERRGVEVDEGTRAWLGATWDAARGGGASGRDPDLAGSQRSA